MMWPLSSARKRFVMKKMEPGILETAAVAESDAVGYLNWSFWRILMKKVSETLPSTMTEIDPSEVDQFSGSGWGWGLITLAPCMIACLTPNIACDGCGAAWVV